MTPRRSLPRELLRWLLPFLVVLFTSAVIASQVSSRDDFAASELKDEAMDRWGAPVDQPAPSLRAVPSGTVFTELSALPLARQHVTLDAHMNYRKRGLRYFSGFDFAFTGHYAAKNSAPHDVDVVFVFPLEVNKAQVLLSELAFQVDGQPQPLELGEARNRLVWTGRIPAGKEVALRIGYRARGLDQFVYRLDPALPANDVRLHVGVEGGDNFDYPHGALSASTVTRSKDAFALDWQFSSLESGVALGVVLPSQQAWDAAIATMATRSWAPALALFAMLFALSERHRRPLALYERLLVAALFGFTFVLTAYLAAFWPFLLAWPVAVLGLGAAFVAWLGRVFEGEQRRLFVGLWLATMVVPSGAVVLTGYTGLIYTLELLTALLAALALSTKPAVRAFLDDVLSARTPTPSLPQAEVKS